MNPIHVINTTHHLETEKTKPVNNERGNWQYVKRSDPLDEHPPLGVDPGHQVIHLQEEDSFNIMASVATPVFTLNIQ